MLGFEEHLYKPPLINQYIENGCVHQPKKHLEFPLFLGPFCFLNVMCGSGGAPIRREQVGKAPS